ncbi:VRR-NUC domain-containing protein [Halomonas sp. DX6]|uniref:VRR-NUC domain-containing protein n=2 Tax=Billgrantia bachuensis TaxID=2717286 RepID=A0ABX0PUX6_9GAMM|nr:VRR-NUC domain-containing protein [Halomonas bachuensis]NIC05244.1 VRR-NUC domain-containing protein [Halomonas bachuensis]
MAQVKRNPPPGVAKPSALRQRRVDWEGNEQAVVIRWLLGEKMRGTKVGELYDVIYHVPNGGARHGKTGADLKKQGVKPGVSDLVVMDARGGWHGLYLEFKATPPKHAALATSQRDWLALAESRGYCALLARGYEEAKAVLSWYASLMPTQFYRGEAVDCPEGTEWRKGEEGDGDCSTGSDIAD